MKLTSLKCKRNFTLNINMPGIFIWLGHSRYKEYTHSFQCSFTILSFFFFPCFFLLLHRISVVYVSIQKKNYPYFEIKKEKKTPNQKKVYSPHLLIYVWSCFGLLLFVRSVSLPFSYYFMLLLLIWWYRAERKNYFFCWPKYTNIYQQ